MMTNDFLYDSEGDGKSSSLDLRSFLARAQKAVPIFGEVSVRFTSDSEITRLNKTFRGKNKATDVLSFPAAQFSGQGMSESKADKHPRFAGDLAISIDTAKRQADQFGHSLQIELKILLLHGLLHLAGYDHESDEGEMAAREEELRRRFRLPVTLIARATRSGAGRHGARR